MKRILVYLLFLVLSMFSLLNGRVLLELPELTRPSTFLVNYDRVYVLEEATVHIYSLNTLKLLKKFGKAGEGPGEFKYNAQDGRPLSMNFFRDELVVNSLGRMSFFDRDGNFLREEKLTVDRLLFPVNGKYVGIGPTTGEKDRIFIGFTLYSDNFRNGDVIFLSDFEMFNPSRFVLPVTGFTYNPVYKGKIYINSSSEEFAIRVLGSEGKKEYTIRKNYPKNRIPDSFRDGSLEFFRTHPQFRNAYEIMKKALVIREYFPPIRDLQITDDHLYVITYKRKGELWECIKLDLKGNEKEMTFVVLDKYQYFSFYPILYSVWKDRVYSLAEDEEDEVWKIHVKAFK